MRTPCYEAFFSYTASAEIALYKQRMVILEAVFGSKLSHEIGPRYFDWLGLLKPPKESMDSFSNLGTKRVHSLYAILEALAVIKIK